MWQNLPILLSPSEAAHVQTVLSITYTLGPAVTAFVALKVSPDIIVSYHFVFLLTGLAMLYFGQASMYLIYTGSAIIGYGMSAMVSVVKCLLFDDQTGHSFTRLPPFTPLLTVTLSSTIASLPFSH